MYKSPLEINYTEPIYNLVDDAIQNQVVKVVQSIGIDVDKAELLKALTYDRMQYDKGYIDGRRYKPPIVKNADRIRSMTNEELAHLLHSAEEHLFTGNLWNYEKWMDWLNQEVDK